MMVRLDDFAADQVVPFCAANSLNEVGFCAWIAQSEPGETLVYHRGFLAVDATAVLSKLPGDRQRALRQVAAAALRAAEQNLVHLVQARIAPTNSPTSPSPGQPKRRRLVGPPAQPRDAAFKLFHRSRRLFHAFPREHPHAGRSAILSAAEIAALPVELLAILQREIDERLKRDKAAKTRFDAGLDVRYSSRAAEERQAAGKDTGTVRFDDGDFTVVADLPKRVDWDQGRLAGMVARIEEAGDDPTEYVDLAFKVPERKYAAWPEAIRQGFEPARTVRPGSLKVEILAQGTDQ